MPQNVIVVLLRAMETARPVAEKAGFTIVAVEPMQAEEGGASTDTVFDVTNTLITDVGELSLEIGGEDVAAPAYSRPGRSLPSHAYQLTQVFSAQVRHILQQQAERGGRWLCKTRCPSIGGHYVWTQEYNRFGCTSLLGQPRCTDPKQYEFNPVHKDAVP
jgi:hypothetical protein